MPLPEAKSVALRFPGFGGLSQETRATPPENGPVAPTFSAFKGGAALQVGVLQKGSRERRLPVFFFFSENETEEKGKNGRKRKKTEENGKNRNPQKKSQKG